jgi:hypothetical protein
MVRHRAVAGRKKGLNPGLAAWIAKHKKGGRRHRHKRHHVSKAMSGLGMTPPFAGRRRRARAMPAAGRRRRHH